MIPKSPIKPSRQQTFYIAAFHFLTAAALFVFVIFHAFSMDITHDEAYSFFLVKTNYYRAMPGSANTHWLNSFFIKIFNLIFGDGPGWMRLHSVLAFPFFAFGISRLSCYLKNKFLRQLFYCLVLFNPYMLDFFSLARGYAMALAFQVWLVIFLAEALTANKFVYTNWLYILLLAALTIASNLSFLYSVLGVAGVFMLLLMMTSSSVYSLKDKKTRRIAILFCLLIVFTIADLFFIKYHGKDLGYGGDHDMVLSTIGSVWKGSLYFSSFTYLKPFFTYGSFILLIAGALYFLFISIKKHSLNIELAISSPIISILILNILFHLFFKTPFLYGRTALQWLPIGLLVIFLFLAEITPKININNYVKFFLGITLCLVIIIHFVGQANTHYCFEWRAQSEGRQCLEDLYQQHPKHPAIHKWIGGVYLNYYRIIDKNLAQLSPAIIDEDSLANCNTPYLKKITSNDCLVIASPETIECSRKAGVSYEIVRTYKYTSDKLIKPHFKDKK